VRFYLNYQLFEDDAAPYIYKESGFEWIDTNIRWAKKHHIGLIFNMHVPQGGYQSQGNGSALWNDPECQKRLQALWEAFAKRYADEPAIIGYGLINEPIIPMHTTLADAVSECQKLMQTLADAIRSYDRHHILFVERLCAFINLQKDYVDWEVSVPDTQFLIHDTNTVYEFHSYEPHKFTHQDISWAGTQGLIKYYPSDEMLTNGVITGWAGCCLSHPISEKSEDGWVSYQSEPVCRTKDYNVGSITLRADSTGADGMVLFDDVVVEEYRNGCFSRIIKTLDFDHEETAFFFWSENGDGESIYLPTSGYTGGCMAISGNTADANISGYRFELKENCTYIIKGRVKKINTDSDAMPRIDFSLAKGVMALNADYLEAYLLRSIEFGKKHHVPMYLGEFGAASTCFVDGRGGAQWVTDMLNICKKHQIHFTYHIYHENPFGLYLSSAAGAPAQKNEALARVFQEQLS
jgi:endoglucanase